MSGTYTEADYHSNDGMLTYIWGPPLWHVLHTMSFNYPVEPSTKDKHHYRDFMLSLQHVLPCGKCRKNLHTNLRQHPLLMKHMASRDSFSKYVYELHEVVNKMLGKESHLSYEDVRERYEHFRARCAAPTTTSSSSSTTPTEKGCVVPLTGEKAKCVLQIVPLAKKCPSLTVDKKCIKKRAFATSSHRRHTVKKKK